MAFMSPASAKPAQADELSGIADSLASADPSAEEPAARPDWSAQASRDLSDVQSDAGSQMALKPGWSFSRTASLQTQEAELLAAGVLGDEESAEQLAGATPADPATPSQQPVRHGWGLWKQAATSYKESKTTDPGEKTAEEPNSITKILKKVQSVKDIGPVTVKVMISGAAQLRKFGFNGTMNPYVTCEVPGRAETRWESKIVFNSYSPVWRQTHIVKDFWGSESLAFAVMDYQKTHHPDTKKQETKRILVGKCSLDADRFLGEKAASLLGRNHGLETCLKLENSETGAYLKLRIFVKEALPKPKKEKPRAKAKAITEEEDVMSPWQVHLASLCTTPRVVPGQVLVPTSKPVYRRLFGEQKEKMRREKERRRKEIAHLEELDDARLLPFHHLKAESEERIDEIVDRLYNDAGSRQSKLQMRIDQRMNEIDGQMGLKYLHSYAQENIEEDDTSVWDRLVNYADVHRKRLEKKRADRDQAEERYMEENSVHANVEEDRDFEQVFGRLYTLHDKKLQRIKKTAVDEEKRWHDIITHDSEEMLSNKTVRGIKVIIRGASDLAPEIPPKPTSNEAAPEPAPEASPLETTLPPSETPAQDTAFPAPETSAQQAPPTGRMPSKDHHKEEHHVDAAELALGNCSAMASLQKGKLDAKSQEALNDLLSRLRTATIGVNLHKFFRRFDKDRSGTFEFDELRRLIRIELRIRPDVVSDKDIQVLMSALDDDASGTISIDELVDFIERGVATLNSGPLEQDKEKMEAMRMEHGLGNFMGMCYCVCEWKAQEGDLPAEVFNMDTQRYTGDAYGRIKTKLKRLETNGSSKVDWNEEHDILAEFSANHFLEFKIMQRASAKKDAPKDVKEDVMLGAFKIRAGDFMERGFDAEVELLNKDDFEASRSVPQQEEEEVEPGSRMALKRSGWGNKTAKKDKAKVAEQKNKVLQDLLSRLRTATTGMCLQKFFQKFDKDRSGSFEFDELKRLVRVELRIRPEVVTDKDLQVLMQALDDDNSGSLAIDELVDFIENGRDFLALQMEDQKTKAEAAKEQTEQEKKEEEEKEEKEEQAKKEQEEKEANEQAERLKKEEEDKKSNKKKGKKGVKAEPEVVVVEEPPVLEEPEEIEEIEEKKPAAKLRVKVVLLSPNKERRLYVERSTKRLYDHHILIEEKYQERRRKQIEILAHKADRVKPNGNSKPGTPKTPMTLASTDNSPAEWTFGDRLYNDAHRRNADLRAKQRQVMENMHTNYEKESVHAVLNNKMWMMTDINNVFERMYNPPPRAFQIKLGAYSDVNEIEDDYEYEEEFEGLQIEVEADAGAGVGKQNRTPREPSPDRGRRGGIFHKHQDTRQHPDPSFYDTADMDNVTEAQDADPNGTGPLSAYYTPDSTGRRNSGLLRRQNGGASTASSPRRGFSPQGSPRLAGTGRSSPGRRTPESSRSRGNTPQRSQPRRFRQDSPSRIRQESPATARRRQESPDSFPNATPQADYFGSPAMTQFASPALTTFSDWQSQGPSAPGSPRSPQGPRPTLEDIMKIDAASRPRAAGARSAPASPAPQRRPSSGNGNGRNSRVSMVAFNNANNGTLRSGQQSASTGALARQSLVGVQDPRDFRASLVNGPSTPATSSRVPGGMALYQGPPSDAQLVRPGYGNRNADLDYGAASAPLGAYTRQDAAIARRNAASMSVGRLPVQSARASQSVAQYDDYFSKPPSTARASTRASTNDFALSNSRPSSAGRISSFSNLKQPAFNEDEQYGNPALNPAASLNIPGNAGGGPQGRKLNLPGQAGGGPSSARWKTAVNTVRAATAMSNLKTKSSGLKSDNFKFKGGIAPREGPRVTISEYQEPRSSLRPFANSTPPEQPSPARLSRALLQPPDPRSETPSRRNSWGSIGRVSIGKSGDEQQVRWK